MKHASIFLSLFKANDGSNGYIFYKYVKPDFKGIFISSYVTMAMKHISTKILNQRSLRDLTILYGVCVGEMLVLKAICDALTH